MRLAFVDLLFSWPPSGGADVDLFHTVSCLQELGHDVHVFVAGAGAASSWGDIDPATLPFPATRIEFDAAALNPREAPVRFRAAVDAWKPDAVFMADGFFLKPFVANALADYPMIGRFYAYEVACIRDSLLFKEGAPCPLNYLRTPDECRRCAADFLRPQIQSGRYPRWTEEFLTARAYMPAYHRELTQSIKQYRAVIVYNTLMKDQLAGINDRVHVVPGGVEISEFDYRAPVTKGISERKVILMTGRVEDRMKGLEILLDAGALLAKGRSDFEIRATLSDPRYDREWFKAIGWHDRRGLVSQYAQADICVVPSIWEEPFGLVAAEAMAAGRPVCASRAGGLQHIVRDGETGFLVERANPADLARRLGQLLDDAGLRTRMGTAARGIAETEYDWKRIVSKYYPPLLEGMRS
ncbi:MAG: glycosyltransferase family 4 protein [Candidatus Hydrogenedentes bacterium]|nr:glycosyltransferase family 4 protein [Candidatus Hydrogenedentota bacterium]